MVTELGLDQSSGLLLIPLPPLFQGCQHLCLPQTLLVSMQGMS